MALNTVMERDSQNPTPTIDKEPKIALSLDLEHIASNHTPRLDIEPIFNIQLIPNLK